MQWYYSNNGSQQGPVSEEALEELIARGEVVEKDLVWKDGMTDWVPLSKVPELNAAVARKRLAGASDPAGPPASGDSPYQPPLSQPAAPPAGPMMPGVPPEGSGKATASMVLGICSLVLFCLPCVGLILGILAVVFAGQVSDAARSRPELLPFEGKAKAGKIMGIIAIVLSVLNMIAGVILQLSGGMEQISN